MNAKSIIKIIALALAGVAVLTAVGFGVNAIVDYTKNDLKKITPTFEVGNLGSDGKYVNDESTLYTKEAFGCYGLQVKPDFDSTVNYQIFYYDILDNYISSTSVLSDGFSDEAPLNGAYARLVIEPRDDEDGKISWTERISYPKQLTVKVNKEQDIAKRFISFNGKLLQRVNSMAEMKFEYGIGLDPTTLDWSNSNNSSTTTSTFLSVSGGEKFTVDFSSLGLEGATISVYQFTDLPSNESFIGHVFGTEEVIIEKKVKYVLISSYHNGNMTEVVASKLANLIKVSKTK